MYPIGKVWLNVCSQADDGKSNAGDMQGRSQCREENNEKDMYLIFIYIYMVPLQNWPQNSRSQKGYKTP